MALIRNTAAMRLRGRIGNTTYYTEGGRQIARVSQNSSNYGDTARRTEAQQAQRAKWGNLVNFYKASARWMPKAFETKKATQSDYNRFMQLNVASARIYLTRAMYAVGGCVVDGFRVSEGSLKSIRVVEDAPFFKTDLSLGTLTITDDTTVAQFSQALIENNSHLYEGCQISFVSYQQDVAADGTPTIICAAYEVTLSLSDATPVRTYLPSFCCNNVSGNLGTGEDLSTGAFAYVLSDSSRGSLKVSTQQLIVLNQPLITMYSSEEAKAASIGSYGVDADVFLASGSQPQGPIPQPNTITSISSGGKEVVAGSYVGDLDSFVTDYLYINFLNALPVDASSVSIGTYPNSEASSAFGFTTVEESVRIAKADLARWGGSAQDMTLRRIGVKVGSSTYTIEFAEND